MLKWFAHPFVLLGVVAAWGLLWMVTVMTLRVEAGYAYLVFFIGWVVILTVNVLAEREERKLNR